MTDADADTVRREFGERVNMTASELDDWLATDESKSVGQKDGGGESVGHESGRRIAKLLRTKKDDLTAADLEHMQKVNGLRRPPQQAAAVRRRDGHALALLAHELGARPAQVS